jgi:hypothetical protein
MTLRQTVLARRDLVRSYLYGYHGPGWRKILLRKGLPSGVFDGNFPSVDLIDRYEAYAKTLGFSPAFERNPRATFIVKAKHASRVAKQCHFDTQFRLSEWSRFRAAIQVANERAKRPMKPRQMMGYVVPSLGKSGKSGPDQRVRRSIRRADGTGGRRWGYASLSPQRAKYNPSRDPLQRCVNAIFARFPVETWEMDLITVNSPVDIRGLSRHIPVARLSVEPKKVWEVKPRWGLEPMTGVLKTPPDAPLDLVPWWS